jgi:hypothetical protein
MPWAATDRSPVRTASSTAALWVSLRSGNVCSARYADAKWAPVAPSCETTHSLAEE